MPATKAVPKEMLPVVDRPLIQHTVEEVLASGVEQLVFVTGRGKAMIEDHFDRHHELERALSDKGKMQALEAINGLVPAPGQFSFVRQQEPLGAWPRCMVRT